MRWTALILLFLAGLLRGEENIRIPGGEIILHGKRRELPAEEPLRILKTKADTRGVFHLSYRLTKEGAVARAERVEIGLKNTVRYHEAPTEKLTEHEAVHVRINEAAARKMKEELASFTMAGMPLNEAEKNFRARFKSLVSEAEEMHRAWDQNHTFPVFLDKGEKP
jgi:hypothetical protein